MEGEIDLIATVREILVASIGTNRVVEAYDTNRFIVMSQGRNSDVQRSNLNRYWSYQLLSAPAQSQEERYCLIPNGTISDWLGLFQSKIMPFVIEHSLPII
jgi:hypothetical protein